jgi:SAM-dependent methyltransferase
VSVVASRYRTQFLRSYARSKIATDPAYRAVFEALAGTTAPLLDLGCGIGLLPFYLRQHGFTAPITGVDHDRRKIDVARRAADGDRDLHFVQADAREPMNFCGNVVLLDVLHYFTDDEQSRILERAARSVPPGGLLIIRDGLHDATVRYRITHALEAFARAVRWLKAERLNFPTRECIERPLRGAFDEEVRSMSGFMPFNNYLFVFRRSSAGITNA